MTNNAASTVAALRRVTGDYINYMKTQGDTAVSKWNDILPVFLKFLTVISTDV